MATKEGVFAMDIARQVYGQDSEEYRQAEALRAENWAEQDKKYRQKEEKDEERDVRVTISKDATFADLFRAIEKLESKRGVVDFFGHRSFSEDDITTFLPIRFRGNRASSQ